MSFSIRDAVSLVDIASFNLFLYFFGDSMDFKDYGFRFFVTGMRGNKYGIKDLNDDVTEFYTLDELISIVNSGIFIKGVSNGVVNLNWFHGYIRREWAFRKSDFDFVKKFGLIFSVKKNSDKLQLYLCGSYKGSTVTFSFHFHEFVNTFDLMQYLTSDNTALYHFRLDDVIVDNMIKIEEQGVGFNWITDDTLSYFPYTLLSKVNFDKYCPDAKVLNITAKSIRNTVVNMHVHSLRPLNLHINCIGRLSLEFISSDCGDIKFSYDSDDVYIYKKFADYVKFSDKYGYFNFPSDKEFFRKDLKLTVDSEVFLGDLFKFCSDSDNIRYNETKCCQVIGNEFGDVKINGDTFVI